ncbi:MAG: hypothetical protein CMJ18_00875 [Phycisphaeraceae bacterium]|nr:hypothetical protein [Phycisphaeraceae bacterium]
MRDSGDASQGGRILGGQIFLRDICTDVTGSPQLGFTALSRYWQITNESGDDVVSILVDTFGTDNLNPTSQTSIGPRRMTDYDNFLDASVTDGLERILHQWTDPISGSISDGESTKISLRQDVWDWTVSNPRAITAGGQFVPVALANTIPFMTPQIQGAARSSGADDAHGLAPADAPVYTTKSILLSNDTTEPMAIDQVLLAPVGDINPQVIDDALLNQLDQLGRFERVQAGGALWQTVLAPSTEFYLLLEGDVANLPGEVLTLGNFIEDSHPGWMDQPLVAAVFASNSETSAISYALLNSSVYVPEPGTALMLVAALTGGCSRRRR